MIPIGTIFQPLQNGSHLHVVISNEINGKVLCVNITDALHDPDSPCKIMLGEHTCIIKDSVVPYRRAKEYPAKAVEEQLKSGVAIRHIGVCSPQLLTKIIQGAKVADDLTARFLDYLT